MHPKGLSEFINYPVVHSKHVFVSEGQMGGRGKAGLDLQLELEGHFTIYVVSDFLEFWTVICALETAVNKYYRRQTAGEREPTITDRLHIHLE